MSNKENFKIIAINVGKMLPTKDTRKNSLLTLDASKNLKKNQIYQFRNEYQFRKNDFSEVEYIPKTDVNLYELKTSINNIPININAVVKVAAILVARASPPIPKCFDNMIFKIMFKNIPIAAFIMGVLVSWYE